MSSAERLEDPAFGRVGDVFPLKQLPERWIIRHSHYAIRHLQLKVQVSNDPAEPGGNCRI
jgi:hypothetical protein